MLNNWYDIVKKNSKKHADMISNGDPKTQTNFDPET